MAHNSLIEWTQSTWNPVTGCTKISIGCNNCYAERFAKRLQAAGVSQYINGFKVKIHPESFSIPLKWKKPRVIFVNSMSDLFHEEVPDDFIFRIFEIMKQANWHVFQILTKRSERMLQLSPKLDWQPNIWMGVTIETQDYIFRLEHLKKTKSSVKFISFEPLLSDIKNLRLKGIDWVIVGGESGPKSRPMKKEWVVNIRNSCIYQNIPFFFKQWGGFRKKVNGRLLEGKTWNEMPELAFSYRI